MAKIKEREANGPSSLAELAERIVRLESELEELKSSVFARDANAKMLATFGSMPDDEISRNAERLGCAWRERQAKC